MQSEDQKAENKAERKELTQKIDLLASRRREIDNSEIEFRLLRSKIMEEAIKVDLSETERLIKVDVKIDWDLLNQLTLWGKYSYHLTKEKPNNN